jgi:hypothetical protein
MGKLAVPEHILNKPGGLTEIEYEKIKLHANVGADILSAIDFPYPVVPIVRHHHENWDGTGYPSGLKGTDIPIGARILSVVDCFDALTSDRPYRPRLPDNEALRILTQRRGTMYDPLIVDTFVKVHRELALDIIPSGPRQDALNEIASIRQSIEFGRDSVTSPTRRSRTEFAAETAAKQLRALVPFSLCVVYSHNRATGELEALHAIGDTRPLFKGLRILVGQRLSGWVAANRQSILNGDPALDLAGSSQTHQGRLKSCLSVPLLFENDLVGVLTLYSTVMNGFDEEHQLRVEIAARHIAHVMTLAEELDRNETGTLSQTAAIRR